MRQRSSVHQSNMGWVCHIHVCRTADHMPCLLTNGRGTIRFLIKFFLLHLHVPAINASMAGCAALCMRAALSRISAALPGAPGLH
jgi:hypothetical protein